MHKILKDKIKYMSSNMKSEELKGFTLVESLVAISILTICIMAPLGLALQTVKYSRIATNKIEATYMAEQSVELIYNLKKSAEIYCKDPLNGDLKCSDYFTNYFVAGLQTGSADPIIDGDCFGVGRYCNFSIDNMVYNSLTNSTKLIGLNAAQVYVNKRDDDTALVSSDVANFKRSVNISLVDNNIDSLSGDSIPNSILVTSIVCIDEPAVCDANSINKVVLQNLITR